MKRLLTAILGIAVLVIVGCDLTVPNSVTVEIDQSDQSGYQIPAGERTVVISDFWDIGATLDDVAAGVEGLERISTDPGEVLKLQFLQDLIDIPVDTLATDSLALGSVIEPISVTADVPTVGVTGETVATDIPPIELPGTVSIPPISISVPLEPPVSTSLTGLSQTINATGFTSVEFDSGTLEGTISLTDATPGLTVVVDSAEIQPVGGGTPIQATSILGSATASSNATITFQLDGVQLPSDFDVVFEVTGEGGDGTTGFDLDTNFTFAGTTTLSAATGVDFSDQATGSYEVPVSSSLGFESATIDPVSGGSLSLEIALPGSGWSGVVTDVTVTLSQNSTTLTTAGPGPSSAGSPFVVDLSGTTLTNAPIQIDYTVDVTGTSADFVLEPAADEVTTTIDATINQFSQVVIDESLFNTISPVSQPIDESTRLLVESVDFAAATVSITLTNDLPVDIAVDITSTTQSNGIPITFNSADNVFPAASSNQTRTWNIAPDPLFIDMTSLDLTVAVTLQDGSPGDGTVTLGPVVPGSSLAVTGEVDDGLDAGGNPDGSNTSFDVAAITISSTTETGSFPGAADPGMDFSGLGTFLPDGVGLKAITDAFLNFTVDLSDYSSGPSISMHAYADYDGDPLTGDDREDLIGTASTPEVINPSVADKTPSVPVNNLATVINDAPSAMKIFYEVTANSISLTPGANELVRAQFAATVPLSLESSGNNLITDDAGNSIVPATQGDLLGRTGVPEEDAEIEGLLALAEEVSINFTELKNDVGVRLRAQLYDAGGTKDDGTALGEFTEDFELKTIPADETYTFELTREEIQRIIDDDAFEPVINLYILDGSHDLLTDGSITLAAWLGLKVNGSYEVFNATEASDGDMEVQ